MIRFQAEFNDISKWIRLRTDWLKAINGAMSDIQCRLEMRKEGRVSRRVSKLSEDQKKEYYCAEVRKIEKKLAVLVPEGYTDCSWSKRDKVKELLARRRCLLNDLFRATPDEVKRLEELNQQLQTQSLGLVSEMTKCYRQMLSSPQQAWEYEIAGSISCDLNVSDTMVVVEGDDYYCSDFAKMIEIQLQLNDECGLGEVFHCLKQLGENDRPDMTDEELEIVDPVVLNDDWKEGYWCRTEAVSHIRFSHALHHLDDHMRLPMIDILHLNAFCSRITQESFRLK